jgi:hypothetical protein
VPIQKPAIKVSTGPGYANSPPDKTRVPAPTLSASAREPFREFIEAVLAKGRNAWPFGKTW